MADEESPRTAATWRRTASHRKSYGTSQRTFEFLRLASSCWLWSCLPASKRSRRWPSSTCCLGTPQLHSRGVDSKDGKAIGAKAVLSELLTSAPPPRLSLVALQVHYAVSCLPMRPGKFSGASALAVEACRRARLVCLRAEAKRPA